MARKIEKEIIVKELLKRFDQFEFIDEFYLNRLVDGFYKDEFTFDGIDVVVDGYQVANSSYYYVLGICQNILNSILCRKAATDDEILLSMMLRLNRTVNFVCNKLKKPLNDPIYDEYIQDCIFSYNLSTNQTLEQFVTKYLLSVFNTHYVVPKEDKKFVYRETTTRKKVEEVEEVEVVETSIGTKKKERDYLVPGTANYDSIISLFKKLKMKNVLGKTENDIFNTYVDLRFGYSNGQYYTLEEIATITRININEIESYERYVLESIKKEFNKNIGKILFVLK